MTGSDDRNRPGDHHDCAISRAVPAAGACRGGEAEEVVVDLI